MPTTPALSPRLLNVSDASTLVVPLPDGYSADNTACLVAPAFRRQPPEMVKTLTWDQGTEMARWADVEHNLDIDVFFCAPRSRWHPATNEPTDSRDAGCAKAPTSTST
ncbi:MAG: hypothetical protein OXB92_05470 [Acidimicrobiaceae bacterium]|nr:hypothetical protein [Acidimicrobiaceae bacterium]